MNLTATSTSAQAMERPEPIVRRLARIPLRRILAAFSLVGVGMMIGVVGERLIIRKNAASTESVPDYGVRVKPGPWGELYAVPFTIAAPEDVLPVRAIEEKGTVWVFKNTTRVDFEQLLHRAEASDEEESALMKEGVLEEATDGITVTPPPETVISLSPEVREAIYERAVQYEENRSQIYFIHRDSLKERFDGSGVADSTVRLFKRLCWESGDYYVFSGLAAVMAQLPTFAEKAQLIRAITRQKTMMLRLRVTPDSDLDGLARYWGRGCWSTDIRTILQSVSHSTGGTWVNVLMVLPPVPCSQLYYYPVVQDNPMDGPIINRDCHWSSLNFFRDKPDPQFANPSRVLEEFKTNYYPIAADPRYGDVLILSKPDGTIVHSAVFIADDIVFTKNGATVLYPWMLSKVPDLLKQYSFEVGPNEKLRAAYYRNKLL